MHARGCLSWRGTLGLWLIYVIWPVWPLWAQEAPVSVATEECLDCHAGIHAGIAADWKKSRHAAITPMAAMSAKGTALKLSSTKVPEALLTTGVGCAECHLLRPEAHADTFEHNGYQVHVVVTPDDCAVCHPVEREQFSKNILAMAYGNLADNTLYNDLQRTILGAARVGQERLAFSAENDQTRADACYYCHGTQVKVSGIQTRDTDAGEMEFPILQGWPNQGVGRINPDTSKGSCSACHTRHQFSMAMARQPHTCKECHVGPDVPAYKVYSTSKHGNIYASLGGQWNFDAVPWTAGEDFTAPTCATCHISLVVNREGGVLSQRTHQMSDRLGWRIFGLPYAHPQPKTADTTMIRNASGLPLPTDLDGTSATPFLIGAPEIEARRRTMRGTCAACHDTSWVQGYFERLDNTIATTNASVKTATVLMQTIWAKGHAQDKGPGANLFDEYIERRWSDVWLLYANNIRFVSAMAGGGDYGVFEDGRYQLTQSIMEIDEWVKTRELMAVPKVGAAPQN